MGARKGQNNFGGHQQALVDGRIQAIASILSQIGRGRCFRDFHALARHVAEGIGCHVTTITRNDAYTRTIWEGIAAHPALLKEVTHDVAPSAVLQAAKLAAEIELNVVKRENDRMREYIRRGGEGGGDRQRVERDDNLERDFSDTASMVADILGRLAENGLGIEIDRKTRSIVDVSEYGSRRTVVGPPRSAAWFEWLRQRDEVAALVGSAVGG